jgi:transposase
MEVQLRDPADRAALERGAVTRNDPTRRDRFRAVLHAVDGMEAVPIASKIHRSRRFVQNWVYRYRDGGVAAMEDKPRPGKACKLTAEERERFRRRILDGPTEDHTQKSATFRDIRDIWGTPFLVRRHIVRLETEIENGLRNHLRLPGR